MKKEMKEIPLPPSGGSWRQDPVTGELVQVTEADTEQSAAMKADNAGKEEK